MSKTAILFSGQGAQTVGMGRDLYETSESAKKLFEMGEAIAPGTIATCFEGPGDVLTLTENTQPCLFLTALAFANALKEAGISADAAAGFSLGEIAALAYTGILSTEDAFRLIMVRGRKMGELARIHEGGMVAALKLSPEVVETACSKFEEVWPVNYNCPGQISCAGRKDQLDGFAEEIKAQGGRAVKLAVSGAFHTPYMREAGAALEETLRGMEVHAPQIAIYANRTGEEYPSDTEGIIENISLQVSSSVRFETTLRNLWEKGFDTFIEVGAGKALTGFVKRTLPEAVTYTVTDLASLQNAICSLKGECRKEDGES